MDLFILGGTVKTLSAVETLQIELVSISDFTASFKISRLFSPKVSLQ